MTAVILAAGYGTRMYPLTEQTPKALLPVKGRPILRHLLDKLLTPEASPRRILLVSNHRFAGEFERWIQQAELPVPCEVLDDGSTSDENRLGSVGDLAFAIRARGLDEDLLVLGSDNLFREGLGGFLEFARRKGEIVLGAHELADRALASLYGVLTVDGEGRITAFTEKPKEPPSRLVSTAVYFFPRAALARVLEYASSKERADTLGGCVAWLIARVPVSAYRFRGEWVDIGDTQSYQHAQEIF